MTDAERRHYRWLLLEFRVRQRIEGWSFKLWELRQWVRRLINPSRYKNEGTALTNAILAARRELRGQNKAFVMAWMAFHNAPKESIYMRAFETISPERR